MHFGAGRNTELKFLAMNKLETNLVWIDLEMTGLDPEKDQIIEVAVAVTDKDCADIIEGPSLVVSQPLSLMESMDSWNTRQHKKSGLYKKVLESTNSLEFVQNEILLFLNEYLLPDTSPMCGNSICQDRQFLRRWMPNLHDFFHYRNLDVSSIKILTNLWYPDQLKFKKKGAHRAIDDVRESIAELRYYKESIFNNSV